MYAHTTIGSTFAVIGFAIWPDLPKMQPLNHVIKNHTVCFIKSRYWFYSLHLSESFLDHLLLSPPFNPFEPPGVEQQVLLGCQVSVLDVKLRTHPQMVVDFLDVCADVVAGNAANTAGRLVNPVSTEISIIFPAPKGLN